MRPSVVSDGASIVSAAHCSLLQHGVHAERGVARLLRRPWQRRRRSLKAASDLGVPVVGVGLLYQQGYFRQELDSYRGQQVLYPVNEPGQLPIRPVRTADGELLRIR